MPADSLLIIAIITMLSMALGVVLFIILYQRRVINHQVQIREINRQKEIELIQASIQSEEEERVRIAADLHDDVGVTLASVRLFLYSAINDPSDTETLTISKELLEDSIRKIRNISHKLQPSTLEHLGLAVALQSFMETINRSGSIKATFVLTKGLVYLNSNTELTVYRIVQELTNNIIKHSGADSILLEAGFLDANVIISLTHNGNGLTQKTYEDMIYKAGATGLKNIVNRLRFINASIQFNKESEQQYKIVLTIPL